MAKHMTIDTRKGMAHGLECRPTFAQMAKMFGRAVSTVANEVKNRMPWSSRGYGRTNTQSEESHAPLASTAVLGSMQGDDRPSSLLFLI